MPNARVDRVSETPPCSRCGTQVIMTARMPFGDGVELELCRTCDAGAGAAGRLIAALNLPDADRSVQMLGELVMAWTREALAAKGWHQIPSVAPSLN